MESVVISKPVFKPQVSFDTAVLEDAERGTIVHCTLTDFSLIRIWPTTFLVQDDGTRKKLLQAYNIAEYPDWKFVGPGHCFTLVFEGLDRGCVLFDLLEDIPEPDGFHVANIRRNNADVYRVTADTA